MTGKQAVILSSAYTQPGPTSGFDATKPINANNNPGAVQTIIHAYTFLQDLQKTSGGVAAINGLIKGMAVPANGGFDVSTTAGQAALQAFIGQLYTLQVDANGNAVIDPVTGIQAVILSSAYTQPLPTSGFDATKPINANNNPGAVQTIIHAYTFLQDLQKTSGGVAAINGLIKGMAVPANGGFDVSTTAGQAALQAFIGQLYTLQVDANGNAVIDPVTGIQAVILSSAYTQPLPTSGFDATKPINANNNPGAVQTIITGAKYLKNLRNTSETVEDKTLKGVGALNYLLGSDIPQQGALNSKQVQILFNQLFKNATTTALAFTDPAAATDFIIHAAIYVEYLVEQNINGTQGIEAFKLMNGVTIQNGYDKNGNPQGIAAGATDIATAVNAVSHQLFYPNGSKQTAYDQPLEGAQALTVAGYLVKDQEVRNFYGIPENFSAGGNQLIIAQVGMLLGSRGGAVQKMGGDINEAARNELANIKKMYQLKLDIEKYPELVRLFTHGQSDVFNTKYNDPANGIDVTLLSDFLALIGPNQQYKTNTEFTDMLHVALNVKQYVQQYINLRVDTSLPVLSLDNIKENKNARELLFTVAGELYSRQLGTAAGLEGIKALSALSKELRAKGYKGEISINNLAELLKVFKLGDHTQQISDIRFAMSKFAVNKFVQANDQPVSFETARVIDLMLFGEKEFKGQYKWDFVAVRDPYSGIRVKDRATLTHKLTGETTVDEYNLRGILTKHTVTTASGQTLVTTYDEKEGLPIECHRARMVGMVEVFEKQLIVYSGSMINAGQLFAETGIKLDADNQETQDITKVISTDKITNLTKTTYYNNVGDVIADVIAGQNGAEITRTKDIGAGTESEKIFVGKQGGRTTLVSTTVTGFDKAGRTLVSSYDEIKRQKSIEKYNPKNMGLLDEVELGNEVTNVIYDENGHEKGRVTRNAVGKEIQKSDVIGYTAEGGAISRCGPRVIRPQNQNIQTRSLYRHI